MFWQLFFGFGSTGSQKKDDPCEAGCTAVTLKDARFTAEELRDGGCTAEELRDAGFSAWDLKDAFILGGRALVGFRIIHSGGED